MPSPSRFLVVFFALFTFAAATCYWPTGNATYDRDLYEHQPCTNDTTSPLNTICCALNRTNDSGGDKLNGRTSDECLPNGICRNRVLNHGTMEVSYWRETCTSRDWKTGLCLDVCSDNWTSGNGTTGAIMTPCDGTAGSLKWCCGVDTSCCDDPKQYKLIAFEFRGALPNTSQGVTAPFTTPTPTPSSSTVASSVTTSAAATTTASDSKPESNNGLSTGAKAGIGIAGAIGGLFLLGLGFFIARRTGTKNPPAPAPIPPQVPEKEQHRYELDHQMRTELPYSPAQSPGGPPRKMTPSYEMA